MHRHNALDTARIIALLNVTALMTIMLSMGLQVKFEAMTASARRERRVITLGVIANYVLVPVVTLVFLFLFQTNSLVSAGFLILAVCPGAPVGPPLTDIAKGNVPLSIALMVILAGLSAILSPTLLSVLLVRIAPESDLHIDYLAIMRTLLIAQMLPLALGLAIHHWATKLTERLARPLGLLANVLLLVLIGLIVATQYETLAAVRLRGWFGMSLLFLASLGIGWLCGGSQRATQKAMAVTTTSRNAAVGLVIVTSNFAGSPAVTAVVAYALFSIVGTLGCAALFGQFATSEPANASAD